MTIVAADPRSIAQAAELLRDGRLVAFPTETVYGLGADATNDRAVAAIFAAKGRPSFNPLIIHLAAAEAAGELVAVDDRAAALARRFWPGPLTLVLPRRPEAAVSLLASAGLDSLAVRVPAHPVALALLAATGRPLAAPSANPSGRISPTTARHVAGDFDPPPAMILDGGPCAVGVESTVLDLTGRQAVLLRPGGIARETLEEELGPVDTAAATADPRAPGMLASHYAPARPVRLDAEQARPGEALLGFGGRAPADCLNLSAEGDLAEAAANLFAMLRRLDAPPQRAIAVMPIPRHGLGLAINDRLRRAAAPRPSSPLVRRDG
ncbi:MAG TPA: threonylcarbamoyl-AMP synthase [Rhodospirillaceae bacterium]|nr:threonylcarbamoyl-AMP synthase [Rhodospirillaceae bacterium]